MQSSNPRRALSGDVLCALALAVVMSVGWTMRDWETLSALRLPDLVPGAPIVSLRPLIGLPAANLTAIIVWPAMLLAGALLLVARIARALGGAQIARTAAVVAAVAFPATTIFQPGRSDHYGLQIVLLLVIMRAIIARPTMGAGLLAGAAVAASIVIGMDVMPLIAAAGVAIAAEWLFAKSGADDRMMGFGIALAGVLLAASIVFRSAACGYPECSGFTAISWRGALTAAFAPMGMALAARDIARPGTRAALGGMIAGLVGAGVIRVAPTCLPPHGVIDPLLVKVWLGETHALYNAIGSAGVMVVGMLASGWQFSSTSDRRWAVLLFVQVAALMLACMQMQGAYAGAFLAAPGLAAMIAAARTHILSRSGITASALPSPDRSLRN